MNTNAFPTKGNLMLAKNSLTLAKQGYELMDKKRNILIRELMNLIEEAKTIQSEIDATFTEAYQALQQANIYNLKAPYDIVRKMRASILVLGPQAAAPAPRPCRPPG